MASTERRTRAGSAERGFTLAGLIVVMTIMMIFVAYTVPRQWSTVMKRERERETLYAMQQYAKAISEFQASHQTFPTSFQQLKDARRPRFVRGINAEIPDPLTGEFDWLVIPQSAQPLIPQHKYAGGAIGNAPPGQQPPAPPPPPTQTTNTSTSSTDTSSTSSTSGTPELPGIPIKDYAGGPFIGVRPPIKGKSLMTLFDEDTYEKWVYTVVDYQNERTLRRHAAATIYH